MVYITCFITYHLLHSILKLTFIVSSFYCFQFDIVFRTFQLYTPVVCLTCSDDISLATLILKLHYSNSNHLCSVLYTVMRYHLQIDTVHKVVSWSGVLIAISSLLHLLLFIMRPSMGLLLHDMNASNIYSIVFRVRFFICRKLVSTGYQLCSYSLDYFLPFLRLYAW